MTTFVRLADDAIAVESDDGRQSTPFSEEQWNYLDTLLVPLSADVLPIDEALSAGFWLRKTLPAPLDPDWENNVFLLDGNRWDYVPLELISDGEHFLSRGRVTRFVNAGTKMPGGKPQRLGAVSEHTVLFAHAGPPPTLPPEIARHAGVAIRLVLDAKEFQDLVAGLRPEILIVDTILENDLAEAFGPDYRFEAFSADRPILLLTPHPSELTNWATNVGVNYAVCASRFAVEDGDFNNFANTLLETLDDELPVPEAIDRAVETWLGDNSLGPYLPIAFFHYAPQTESESDEAKGGEASGAPRTRQAYVDTSAEFAAGKNLPEDFDATSQAVDATKVAAPNQMSVPDAKPVAGQAGVAGSGTVIRNKAPQVQTDSLPQPSQRTAEQLSSYRADVATADDRLGFTHDVRNLCQVIMAKQWGPPLSIGLFGDWGSGKSSFIKMMQQTIEATAAKAQDNPNSAFVKDVIQIEFNAWHYLDANLWANLVVQILGGIHREIFGGDEKDPDAEGRQQIVTQLRVVERAIQRAEAEQDQVTTDIAELDTNIANRQQAEADERSVLDVLQAALADPDNAIAKETASVKAALVQAVESLGLADDATLTQAQAHARSLVGLGSRLREAWRGLAKNRLWWVVIPVALLVFVFSSYAASWLQSDIARQVVGTVGTLVTGAFAWMQTLGPGMKRIGQGLDAVDSATTMVANARQGWIQAQQTRVSELHARREAQQQQLDELQQQQTQLKQREKDLNLRLQALREGRGLEEFLMQRAGSAEYQEQLGIISLVHEDMKSLQRKLAGGLVVRDGDTERQRSFDRVVLYVDDLDRCTPERVVEVLQAIHLLLSIPLFVVVVAADARWLLQCLRTHYSALLRREVNGEAQEWSLTPQNYLEKIFQIPFSLPAMPDSEFPKYVSKLLEKDARPDAEAPDRELARMQNEMERRQIEVDSLRAEGSRAEATPDATAPSKPVPSDGAKPAATDGVTADNAASAGKARRQRLEQAEQDLKQSIEALDARRARQKEARKQDPSVAIDVQANASQLTVSPEEQKFIENLLPLLTTPRITKRLLNVYRLIRVSLQSDEMANFERVEHQAVLTLLAIMYSYPSVSKDFFAGLGRAATTDLDSFVAQQALDHPESSWPRLEAALARVPRQVDIVVYRRWLAIVGRFSFEVGRVLRRSET